MDQLIQLIYVSSAVKVFTQQQLSDLLETARAANHHHHITGLLLYKDGNFMQVIEGEEQAIDQLMSNLQNDQRHNGIIQILKEPVQQRNFADWSMGFKNISNEETEGFSDFLEPESRDKLLPGKAKMLLMGFKGR